MGMLVDADSVEDILVDLNKDNTNRSIYTKRFGMNSYSQQVGQQNIDTQYSKSLMSSYDTYLKSKNQTNNLGLIDSMRGELNEYNKESLSKAYEASKQEQQSQSQELYLNYLEEQGYIGEELISLAKSYATRADSYLDYIKQTQLDDNVLDYFKKTGIISSIDESGTAVFADDSIIRGKMFETESVYDEEGNIIAGKGELTKEGKAILNYIQSNQPKDGLSYDAWIENQSKYADENVDKSMMRKILGIEGESGRTYTKRELLEISPNYAQAVIDNIDVKMEESKLTNNTTYNALVNGETYSVTEENINEIATSYNKTISDIKSTLDEYGYSEQEFNEYLESQGEQSLDKIGLDELEQLKEKVITGTERTWALNLEALTTVAVGGQIAARTYAGIAAGLSVAGIFAGILTAGGSTVAATTMMANAIAAVAAAELAYQAASGAEESYKKSLTEKTLGMDKYAQDLGIYRNSIVNKFKEFMRIQSGG